MSIFDPNFPLCGAEMGVWVPKWRCAALRWRRPSLRLSAPGAEWPQNGGIWPQNAFFCPKTLRFEDFLPQILGSNATIGGFLLHIADISHPCPNMMRFSAPKWVFFPPNADFFSPKRGFFPPKCCFLAPKWSFSAPEWDLCVPISPGMELCSPRMGPLFAAALPPPSIPAPPLFAAPNSHFFTPKRSSPFPCLCVFPNEGFFCPPKKSFCAPEWHFRCPVLCSRAPFPPYGPNPKPDFPFFALFWSFLPQTSELP